MDRMYLTKPNTALLPKIREYKEDFSYREQQLFGTSGLNRSDDMHDWLARVQKNESKTLQLLYIREADQALVGMATVTLTDSVTAEVEYSIKPKERRKGYGRQMLSDVIDLCRDKLGLDELYLKVSTRDTAGQKVAFRNEAVWQRLVFDDDAHEMKSEYKIQLREKDE